MAFNRVMLTNPAVVALRTPTLVPAMCPDDRQPDRSGAGVEIVRRAVAGDPAAFELVVRRFHSDLRTYAVRLVGGDADDVLQESYIKAFAGIARFRPDAGSLRGWLFQIVHRTCLDHLRTRRRRPATLHGEVDSIQQSSPEVSIGLVMERALDALTPDQRAAVVLVDALELPYDEVAAIVGAPRGTVASRLNHGRRALHRALIENGYDHA